MEELWLRDAFATGNLQPALSYQPPGQTVRLSGLPASPFHRAIVESDITETYD